MDSRIGLDYIVENREYVSKLGAALDTNNTTVKKQVFELLSALCAYNSEGYSRAIETLEYYKNLKKDRYRFKIVINELENATTVEYQVALLAFINCVIISASNLQNRIRIRNEFIGLKVLPVLNNLKKVAHTVGDIIVQLDVFDEQRECDEAQSLQGPNGINLSSHLDVFYAILRQVADTPQEIPFLSILQHLLRIDPKEPISDIIWDTTEKLVHRATLLENHEDSTRLLRAPSVQKFTCPHCRNDATSPSRKQSVVPSLTPNSSIHSPTQTSNSNMAAMTKIPSPLTSSISSTPSPNGQGIPPPPPPPPPIPLVLPGAPPPPPPPIMSSVNGTGAPRAPPPPPPASHLLSANNSLDNRHRPQTPDPGFSESAILLPQQDTPAPKSKMKTINWNKIPPNKVIGKRNIWAIVADNHQDSPMADIDWNEMEGLFCLQSTSTQGSPKLGRDNGAGTGGGSESLERKAKKENQEITLLDGKRSLNVNIFLKQFRSSNEDIIQLIKDGSHDDIGSEKLRGLLKILPEVDELDMLKSFDGDKARLGNAEKFLMQLLEVPNYKLRIESMLLKEEFAANVGYLEPCINAMLFAGDDLINNKMLQEVLYMVVVAGNFLNSGGYAGNAAGVKLSSLQKLTDIRANKPGMNLIHYVALQAEKRNPELLTFPTQMTALENASKTTAEQINNEINTLDSRIKKIKRQVELPTTDIDIKEQMTEFLLAAEREVSILQRGMKEVESVRVKVAEFFCEDSSSFKMEECFKIFQSFCDKFKTAVNENERRRIQEEQANLRRKQREEQLARRTRQIGQCSTPVSDSESLLLDPSFDPRCSPALSRRRMGSFNSMNDNNALREDGISPDITPNGSLRRRRSRVLAEEDDLMEFLRSSGHDNGNRERKASSYGSLDRSWARRARSGSASKKRPELLNIDFGADRERPNSPSPLAETKSITAPANGTNDESKPRISREWRQKIESWLQSNEIDEKQNDDYKRRRRLANNNRRSLENESESERNKLDPLPEEKAINSNGVETYKRVYPDWKPSATIEKTDIVRTIEAIEDNHTNNRDKSSWRKSNLNAGQNNAIENNDDENNRSYKRQRSVGYTGSPPTSPLHSIQEEDRRKSVIKQLGERDATDRLQIYIRRPSETNEETNSLSKSMSPSQIKLPTSIDSTISTKPSILDSNIHNNNNNNNINCNSKKYDNSNSNSSLLNTVDKFSTIRDRHNEKYSRIEIDADNIETPPVARRALSSPASRIAYGATTLLINQDDIKTNPICNQQKQSQSQSQNSQQLQEQQAHLQQEQQKSLQPVDTEALGHFDRYSAARRTRRYKRPTDYSSGNEDISPTTTSEPIIQETKRTINKTDLIVDKNDSKIDRQQRWSDRLKNLHGKSLDSKSNIPEKTAAKLEKVGRHISSINQEDVREAIRNLKSPTGTPERIWSPPREIVKDKPTIIKISNHELNDEGFEETQSLVSDTPSHGKESTSSCNEPTDTVPKRHKTIRMTSTDSATTTTSSDIPKSKGVPQKSQIQSLLERNKRSMERVRSMRTPTSIVGNSSSSSNLGGTVYNSPAARRTSSLRKSDSSNSTVSNQSKRDVERSSSRTSLRSSRSSLNSAISTNTVRRIPIKPHIATHSVESSPSKRPLASQNLSPANKSQISSYRVPASRSSSSGSSVGPGIRKPPIKTAISNSNIAPNLASTSFKENQSSNVSTKTAARNAILIKTNSNNNASNSGIVQRNPSRIASTTNSRLSGFMRPTASSATKRLQGDIKK